jgi:dUTP pyrophosphatase
MKRKSYIELSKGIKADKAIKKAIMKDVNSTIETVNNYIKKNNIKTRGFLKVNPNSKLPTSQTNGSAGYDFYAPYDVTVKAGESISIDSGITSYMQPNEVLLMFIRSSLGIKHNITLTNNVGVIDSDFCPHTIGITLTNGGMLDYEIKKDFRLCQGIFVNYLKADNGNLDNDRNGGIGSTNN